MSDEILTYIKEITKTATGGAVVCGTTHAAFDVAQATQYASLAAAIATTIYFIVVTVLAIRNRDKK